MKREITIYDEDTSNLIRLTLEDDEYLEVWPIEFKDGKNIVVEIKKHSYKRAPYVRQDKITQNLEERERTRRSSPLKKGYGKAREGNGVLSTSRLVTGNKYGKTELGRKRISEASKGDR